ncbi:MAG: aminoacyl--tRNA ligase-related protein [bacterium]|nr:aminoacyl--tRNA ligase-related protein [bacterium]
MLRTQLFAKTLKETSAEEQSVNAKLLLRAGFVDKEMAGVYTFLPLGLRVLRKIEQIIREEIQAIGGQEILMPALQPKETWQTTGRWDDFDALYKVQSHYDQQFALGPTHEEVVVPLVKKFIQSYKDLPAYLFQIQTKFRDEPRAKSGLLRGREFGMKDLYSFHANQEDLDAYYEKVKQAYLKIFARLGLEVLVTEASGGTFSKLSHEFQLLNEAGEDTVFYCASLAESRRACGWAQNKEIATVKQGDKCPACGKKIQKGQAVEVGNIFKLNTKYSAPFDLKFKDKDGQDKIVIMGCYGIGSTRLMGSIVEAHHDEQGVIWPATVAPFAVIIIPLAGKDESKRVEQTAKKIYQDLQDAGIEVIYDDRMDARAGEKFAEADLLGMPWRVVVSEKTLAKDAVELKRRGEEKIKLVEIKDVVKEVGR